MKLSDRAGVMTGTATLPRVEREPDKPISDGHVICN